MVPAVGASGRVSPLPGGRSGLVAAGLVRNPPGNVGCPDCGLSRFTGPAAGGRSRARGRWGLRSTSPPSGGFGEGLGARPRHGGRPPFRVDPERPFAPPGSGGLGFAGCPPSRGGADSGRRDAGAVAVPPGSAWAAGASEDRGPGLHRDKVLPWCRLYPAPKSRNDEGGRLYV